MSNNYYSTDAEYDELNFPNYNEENHGNNHNVYKYILLGLVVIIVIMLLVFFTSDKSKNNDYDKEDDKSYLTNIIVDGGMLDKNFESGVYDYIVDVNDNKVSFSCTAASDKAKVEGCEEVFILEDGEEVKTKIVVTAENGNVSHYNLTIRKKAPIYAKVDKIVGLPTTWVSSNVTIKVEANAKAGLHSKAYSFDDGRTYQKSNTYVFTKNDTIFVRVRDKNGKESERKVVSVASIDKTTPKVIIKMNESGYTNSNFVPLYSVVTPSNCVSGYSYQWYKNNKPISGANRKAYTATSSGDYKLLVRTNAGKKVYSNTYKVRL